MEAFDLTTACSRSHGQSIFLFLFLLLLLTIDHHLDIIDSKSLLNHSGAAPKSSPSHPVHSTPLHSTPLDSKSKSHTKYKSNKELASLCQQQIFLFQSVLQATVFMLSLLRPLAIIESFHPYPRSIARRGDHLSIYLISHLCIWTPVFGSIHWLWPTISFALRLIILIKLSYLQPGHA